MNSGQRYLRVVLGERLRLGGDFCRRSRPAAAARDADRAVGAAEVASVLNLQPGAGPPRAAIQYRATQLVGATRKHSEGVGHGFRVLPGHHGADPVQVADRFGSDRRRTPGDHERNPLARGPAQAADVAPELRVGIVGHRAAVDDERIRLARVGHGLAAAQLEKLPHPLGIVLIRSATERVEVDPPGAGAGARAGAGRRGHHRRAPSFQIPPAIRLAA